MIAITGGAGAMGTRLTRLLRESGERVRVVDLERPEARARVESLGAEFHAADISDPVRLRGAFDGASAVLHLAALLLAGGHAERLARVNTDGTANTLAAARECGVRRFIHVSSISVTYARQNAYSRSKQRAESLVKASGLDWTILRPTLAWGDPLAAEFGIFRKVARTLPALPLPGGGAARKSPVHVDDLAAAFAACLGAPSTIGRTLALSGPRVVSLRDMALEIRRAEGRRGLILPIPVGPSEAIARMTESVCRVCGIRPFLDWQTLTGLVEDACPSSDEAASLLSWTPRPWKAEP